MSPSWELAEQAEWYYFGLFDAYKLAERIVHVLSAVCPVDRTGGGGRKSSIDWGSLVFRYGHSNSPGPGRGTAGLVYYKKRERYPVVVSAMIVVVRSRAVMARI